MIEMGVEPFITGAAVFAVLAQRLVRLLCPHCAEPYEATWDELMALHVDEKRAKKLEGATSTASTAAPVAVTPATRAASVSFSFSR